MYCGLRPMITPHLYYCKLVGSHTSFFLQRLEKYLIEREPDLVRFMPSTEEPLRFDDNMDRVILVLPSEAPGYRMVPDVNIL